MGIDDGQWLVEQDGVDIGADQPPAQGDFLLAVGGKARGAPGQHFLQVQHAGDLGHPIFHFFF